MSSIKALSKDTTNLICSGQVIKNLGDFVKELIENSLDSEANSIEVICRNYGLDGIEVIDNGVGIKEEDFNSIGKLYHSSKIDKFDDLKTCQSFGFRGEALASISRLARLTIYTKHENAQNGSKLEFNDKGELINVSTFVRTVGTTIQLKDLLHTLPVRQRVFKENFKKDYNEMLRKLTNYAVGYLNLRLICRNIHGNKIDDDICVRQNSHIKDNIVQVFGIKLYQTLVTFKTHEIENDIAEEFKLSDSDLADQKLIKIEGFLSNREKTSGRNSNTKHFFFFNNRPVDYKRLAKLIKDVYKLFNGANCPFILLRIILPSEKIDLNLSPDKYTQNILGLETLIFAMIKQSILKMNEDCFQSLNDKNLNSQKFNAVKIKDHNSLSQANKRPLEDITPIATPSPCKAPCRSTPIQNNMNRLNVHLKGFGNDLSPESDESINNSDNLQKKKGTSPRIYSPFKSPIRKKTLSPRRSPRKKAALASFEEIVHSASLQSGKKSLKRKPNLNDSEYTELKDKSQDSLIDNSINLEPINQNNINEQEVGTKNLLENYRNVIHNKDELEDDLRNNKQTNNQATDNLASVDQAVKNLPTSHQKNDNQSNQIGPMRIEKITQNNTRIVDEVNLSPKNDDELMDDPIDEILKNSAINLFELDKPKKFIPESYSTDIDLKCIRNNFSSNLKLDQASCKDSRFEVKFSLSQNVEAEKELTRNLEKDDYNKMKIIGQFNNGFILAELNGDIFLIDQHAADERFNFEKVCTELRLEPLKCVRPTLLEFTAHDENIIIENLELFEKNGFRFIINNDGVVGKRIKLDAVPLSKSQNSCINDLEEIIDSIVQMDVLPSDYRPSNIKKKLGYDACRKSIMIGDALSENQMMKVLNNLSKVKHPTICAHGRPVLRVLFNINDHKFEPSNSSNIFSVM